MGLSKRLMNEQLSFESVGSGGSSGWQAPEQLISRSGGTARQTNSGEEPGVGLEQVGWAASRVGEWSPGLLNIC